MESNSLLPRLATVEAENERLAAQVARLERENSELRGFHRFVQQMLGGYFPNEEKANIGYSDDFTLPYGTIRYVAEAWHQAKRAVK